METQREQSPNLEDCLKLLKGERDEQRLAGLLLVTKFCKGDDLSSLRRVYDAMGPLFLDRLLRTGMGIGTITRGRENDRDAYLRLSVTVLAAFCRVPEVASLEDMVLKIPLILEVMSTEPGSSVLEECYEFLYLVSTASENGIMKFYESGGIKILASQICSMQDGSHIMEISLKLVQLVLSKISLDIIMKDYLSELAIIVAAMARQFAVLHNSLKFEALHVLSAIISSKDVVRLFDALRLLPSDSWSHDMRIGVVAILQNRVGNYFRGDDFHGYKMVAENILLCIMIIRTDNHLLNNWLICSPAERLQALMLAESIISSFGEGWLINQRSKSDAQDSPSTDMCLLLVLEQSRVEVAVLLNELAYLKYEAPKDTSATAEAILLKRRNVAVAYSLIERIIKVISNVDGNDGNFIDEATLTKLISQLNETIGVILEYLEDAKERGQNKGDDLLASVRIVGSYLAEAPLACKEKVQELLGYMLSVRGEDEQSPFYSVCFLLPMLCQITMKVEGCNLLASCGGLNAVLYCFTKLIGSKDYMAEDNGSVFLACDTIMNVLLKKDKLQLAFDESTIVNILKALAYWAENAGDTSCITMASSICALIFDFTSEESLLNHPDLNHSDLRSLYQLIARCQALSAQKDIEADMDLIEIVAAGYSRWSHRYPHIGDAVKNMTP